jgi:DNA polymerase III subunit delta
LKLRRKDSAAFPLNKLDIAAATPRWRHPGFQWISPPEGFHINIMPEILHAEIKSYLSELKTAAGSSPLPPVILIYGDELLYKAALQTLLDAMIHPEKQAFSYEPVDGIPENVYPVIEKLNTYSFFSGQKVVGFLDTRIFYAKKNAAEILDKAREAHNAKDFKTAARYFFSLLSVTGFSLEDVREKTYAGLNVDMDAVGDTAWLDSLVDYCVENPAMEGSGGDPVKTLQQAVEKGFPRGNHLILTSDMVDKRKGLYKAIVEKGLAVDCSVPKGESWADRQAQEAVLAEQMKTILAPFGKTLDKAAFQKLVEITGFDLRMFAGNLEKLAQVVGERKTIAVEDVESALPRTRQDPIFELTNAVTDRKVDTALFYLKSLLVRGFFPLQIIAAIINQMRKVLVAKDFMESPAGKFWQSGFTFDQFKKQFSQTILPALQAHDAILIARLGEWESLLHSTSESETPPQNKKKKKPAPAEKKTTLPASDLLLVKQPASPYPLYLLMQKTDRFSRLEVIQAIIGLDDANLSLKSSGLNPDLILEKMILKICGLPQKP